MLLTEICDLERTDVPEISDDGWQYLIAHDWPGNVRELKSILHRTVALNRDMRVLGADVIASSAPLGSSLARRAPVPANGLTQRLENAEREEIRRALDKANGVRRKAAEILGISYRGLGKKMVRLGIEPGRRGAGTTD